MAQNSKAFMSLVPMVAKNELVHSIEYFSVSILDTPDAEILELLLSRAVLVIGNFEYFLRKWDITFGILCTESRVPCIHLL